MFVHGDDDSLSTTILKNRLRWLGRALRLSSQKIPHRGLFVVTGNSWKRLLVGLFIIIITVVIIIVITITTAIIVITVATIIITISGITFFILVD